MVCGKVHYFAHMLSKALQQAVEKALTENTGKPVRMLRSASVGGGSINSAARVETDQGIFFLKWNDAKKFPGMFAAEAKGLRLLKEKSALIVPAPVAQGEIENESFLLLEFLERSPGHAESWYRAGENLARQHRRTNEHFGLDHDNYIGSLPQSNRRHDAWKSFFAEERLLPQLQRAYDGSRVSKALVRQAENFCEKISEIFPQEEPALLHGDLWSGNYFHCTQGPAVFDPAVYYGHREMDLAMTKLFGGFADDFYSGYISEFPLVKGWRTRTGYCNLYPLLVHVNLFGGGYAEDVRSVLKNF